MENNYIYRNFIGSDSTHIADIEKMCFSEPWSKSAIEQFIGFDTSHILVSCIDEVIVGYITFMSVLDEIQIANVAVHPDYRRKHIGEGLLRKLDNFSQEVGASVITLEVRASNLSAIRLYKKCCYQEVGVRKSFYSSPKEDAILMNKVLRKEHIC